MSLPCNNRNNLSKFCWKVLAKQIGLSPQSRAAKSLKQALDTARNRKRLAEWLRDPAQLAATHGHAASVVATMEFGRERTEVQELKWGPKRDQIMDQGLQQKAQEEKEEIKFNVRIYISPEFASLY